jgi:hypothetical protein
MAGENSPQSLAEVHANAYRAYVQAMKEGLANLDLEAMEIPSRAVPNAIPTNCFGTVYCVGHVGCAGGCVGTFGTVGTAYCYGASGATVSQSQG